MSTSTLRPALFAFGAALALAAGSAQAAACSGSNVGTATTADVTFQTAASDQCVISGVNPQQGPNGNTSGFDGAFGGGWSLLGKVTGTTGSALLDGVNFSWTFSQLTGKTGTWSLTTDRDATFDLVFAMHGASRSSAFLFDDTTTVANELNPGTWAIHWLDNGGRVPNVSNLTLFARDVALVTTPVPEPETYALLLAGLGVIGFVVRRRNA